MTADQTIKGKLVELLKSYATSDVEQKEDIGDMMERNINVNRQEFFDGKSLYHKNIRSRRIDTQPLEVDSPKSVSDNLMNDMLKQMKKGYPVSKVYAYVDKLFENDTSVISSENIVLKIDEDFILLLLAVLRVSDSEANYMIELGDGMVERNGYGIPRLTIYRKEE